MERSEDKGRDFIKFHHRRKTINLCKSFLVLLEDSKDEVLTDKKYQKIRKRVLDSGNDAIRELEEEANLTCSISDLTCLGSPKPGKHYFLTQNWSGNVNVDKPNPETDKTEHDVYKWATIEEIKETEDTEIPIYLLEKALEMVKNAK